MKVAIFLEAYLTFTNGVRTHVETLKAGLEKLGNEVLIVCALPGIKKHILKDGVLCCPSIGLKKMYNYGMAGPINFRRFKYIKDFKPDVIHIHTEFGIGFSGASIARLLRIPYIYTMHTMYDDYIYYVAPKKLINIAKKTAHFYFRLLAKKATCIIGPSFKAENFLKVCGVKKNIDIIPNSVELSLFNECSVSSQKKQALKEKLLLNEDDVVACFCGRLGKEKSVDVLLKNWSELVKERANYKLLIFGDGPCMGELKSLATHLNLSRNVIFLGKIPHKELPPYYCLCQFYITASLSEVHSISMLEAMSTGLPIFNIYDELNNVQIKEGVNGFIYKNVFDLKRLIYSFESMNEEQKKALRKSTRESVLKYGEEDLARKVLIVYEKALDIYSKKRQAKKRANI